MMKFCYVDESGTGNEPFAVMVGIIVDVQRMKPTKKDWADFLNGLQSHVGQSLRELHTRDFYSGNGVWRNLDGGIRSKIISAVFDWLSGRKHPIVFSCIDKTTFKKLMPTDQRIQEIKTVWRCLGLHMTLSIQKEFQKQRKNKGNTLLIFDNEEREESHFTDLLLDPPKWTDNYYEKSKKKKSLDQIIDVPYFADSGQVPLLQVADFVAYFLRRYCELKSGDSPRYNGEEAQVTRWAQIAMNLSILKSSIYSKRGDYSCSDLFYDLAPDSIREISLILRKIQSVRNT